MHVQDSAMACNNFCKTKGEYICSCVYTHIKPLGEYIFIFDYTCIKN